jgi:hypothetical protein
MYWCALRLGSPGLDTGGTLRLRYHSVQRGTRLLDQRLLRSVRGNEKNGSCTCNFNGL